MNKTYRSVWNAVTNTWTAAAETAKAHSKGSARAARQAVIAIALGGAAIGGAAAAEACTTEDGSSGTVDAAGVCKAAGDGAIGMMGTVGTMATDDTTFVKVNATANPASATGANAIAIGQTVTSAGSSSVAIGSNTTASGLHSVALGAGAKNADASDRQIAIGGQAQTAGKYTIAMGYLASATVEDALAFGRASSATSTGAVAIGAAATSGGTGSTAIGQSAAVVSSATNAVALGMNARVANSYSAAIGSNASAAGNYSSALGTSATSTGTASMALGGNSTATGNYSVAIGSATGMGRAAVATGTSSVAIGTTSSAGANNAVALGFGTVADRDNTVSVGAGVPNIDGNKFTRQIVNVAAGTEDNDAVNVGQMKTALSTKVDDTYVKIDTSNSTAAAQAGTAALAIGTNTSASGSYATAVGNSARASGNNSTALGFQASSAGGAAVAVGNGANASGSHGVALGVNAGASHTDSVALGASSVTDRDNSVSVGSSTLRRQITNVAAGTADTDAVNVAQMNAGLSTTNAAIAATNLNVSSLSTGLSSTNSTVAGLSTGLSSTNSTVAGLSTGLSSTNSTVAGLSTDLSTTNSTVAGLGTDLSTTNSTVAGLSTGLSSTNSTVAGLSTGLSSTVSTVAGHTKQIGDIDDKLSKLESGTTGLVQQANPGDDITVGANTDGNAVDFSSKTGARTLKGVAAGDVSATSTEAVNGSQLHGVSDSVASAIGGGATVNPDGSISAPVFTVGDGSGGTKIVNSVGEVVTNLDGRVTTNEGDIKKLADDIGSGTLGLVQQAKPGDDITVGANTDGNAVDFSSKTGARTLKGVAAGDVSATSTEAINGSQLHGVSDSVASAIGGGAAVNPDGSISAPSFTVGDGSGGTKIVNSVGDVVTNLDGRTTTNEGDIKKLADDIGSGTLGLVQQAKPGDDITVGANTDGNAVDFSSKTGVRTLKGIAAGDVSATSTEAVNGSQLHGVSDSVASAIGGGAAVNPDGSISAPVFTVGDGSGGTKIVNSVGDVVTNLDGRVTTNEGGLKKLSEQLESGTLGLVQQDAMTGGITVGANTGGSVVNFAGTGGARVLSGVANGVDDDDVVTVSQLRATGLIDYTGKEVGAVTYDSGLNFDTVTFAGTFGTKLQRVAAGEISATSMDAINGSQLFDLQEQFAKQYGELSGQFGDLSNRFDDLSDRLGELETNPGTGGPGTGDGSTVVGEGAVASGENSSALGEKALASGENSSAVGQGAVASGSNGSAIGQGSTASGSNSSAVGQGAVASGNNGSAVGQGAVASGENGTALGQGAVASGKDSTALGQGASATGSGSVAIGQGSVATEANTVSFGDGTAEGNRRLVNIADGINASDAATKGQLDRAMESVDQRFNDTNRAINDVAKNAYAGIAAAMAMPNMTPSQPGKTVVAVGAANFKSGSAIAAGATYRSRSGNWLVNGATSITSVGDVGVRAQVGYEF
ncbi:ESPR-type extended signal peptide-containing protein [Burkholderia cenocepacia]|uniref:YadA-like family protein n=1 Tax=Burkholderia cenocepacia TaxID=95486 RepID=A0ABD4UKJ7_9BURK|nr:ESPR-type extended signal peptide-containing protein [Burkholderia cenocepacia]MCW3699003.1 YadA-like family protein [Burkholderia cenocepacia]MCW3706622.1 YadA-like family protein [Burkholderia cenocepacia]MCW3714888.1 YadA-like family protein [Burkholderia cenocepacia]MCW3722796.1 YadA-like family protein [Burkholderia cenocepacia]MCW3729850.1 YadA-like family protein [Burkholderia cenocepacia]